MRLRLFVLILFVAAISLAQAPPSSHKPLSEDEILELVRNYVPSQHLADLVQQYGINFTPGEDYFKSIREAGGEEVLIQALRAAKPQRPLSTAALPEASGDQLKQHLARAAELRKQKDYPQAEKEYRAALQLAPDRADIHFYLGYVLLEQKKWEEAITENTEALRLRPDIAVAHNNLGFALYHEGNLEEAKAQYREALALKPNYPNAHHGLGRVLEKTGDLSAAAQEFHAACELVPADPAYRADCERLPAQTSGAEAPVKGRPEIQSNMDSVRFFETGADLTPMKDRVYLTRFKRSAIRHIGWQLELTHPRYPARVDFEIRTVWLGPGGNPIHRGTSQWHIPAGQERLIAAASWGCADRPCNLWEKGSYQVDFFVAGTKIGTGSFEIH
jgi:tetratricopeptide (TPR) repeat protein